MEKIMIDWAGLVIMEPMAVVWNWLICIMGVIYYLRLAGGQLAPFTSPWRYFFLLFGISCFFGGLGHGLFYYWGQAGKIAPWSLSVIAVFFAETGTYAFMPHSRSRLKNGLMVLSYAKMLLTFVCLTFVSFEFFWVKYNSAVGLAAIVGPGGILLGRRHSELLYLSAGVLVISSAAIVHTRGIHLHRWFNADDLAHLIMMISMGLFYTGVARFGKKRQACLSGGA